MNSESVLRTEGVGKQVSSPEGPLTILSDISLSIGRGEIVGLVGANGAGKSTLLRLACGILEPDSGTTHVCGHPVVPTEVEARRHLAYASDIPAVYPLLSCWEHLRFIAELFRLDSWQERAVAALARFDRVSARSSS